MPNRGIITIRENPQLCCNQVFVMNITQMHADCKTVLNEVNDHFIRKTDSFHLSPAWGKSIRRLPIEAITC